MIRVFTDKTFQQINSLLIRFIASFCVAIVFFAGLDTNAQSWPTDTIHVNINTGNPTFPFPQFLEYQQGQTLAANNAVGVTHADMEKSMREAYQIMMRRSLYVPSKTLGGTQYIQFNNNTVPQNYGTFVSEGDGYALLAAAYFADKKTFDGLWMWVHDNRLSGVKKYIDCTPLRAGYAYGAGFAGWNNDENTAVTNENPNNSAGDGDVDIAMALLIASKQWPAGSGITDACGNPISYKGEAFKMIKVLVDTFYYSKSTTGAQPGVKGYLSGIVGIDGYIKSGNTWGEVTNWRYTAANTLYSWALAKPDPIQVNSPYVDYNAPAYFREFAAFLQANGGTPWEISQCKRCAASGDWTIGQMYAKGDIASAGNYSVSDNGATTTFGSFAAGEDFRCSWRTILNYVWHGNPDSTWNAATHQVVTGGNTFEYDMALRQKDFLKFPASIPGSVGSAYCGTLGASPDPSCPNWRGVAQIKQQYAPNGAVLANYGVNWMAGTGAPAAVAAGDLDLTAELYRQCELDWDDQSGSQNLPDYQRYIGSTPKYFHGWFRTLGMLTTSGNLHPPDKMVAAANVKVYMAVDKTFAYGGDLIIYTISYRNYGSVAASGVSITTVLDSDYQFVSAMNGGSVSGSSITWNIGSIPGFTTGGLAATQGTVTFVVKVAPTPVHSRVCLTSTISASNAPSWTSNEYPNNASYTMERNCVDLLLNRVLAIQKTTDRPVMNSGDVVNFTLNFQNKTGSNLWLNGGRDRVVMSYANFYPTNGTDFYQFYRIWHTAHEAYINLGNYRISYFMNDGAAIGGYNAATNPTGWSTYVDNQNDLNKYGYNPQFKSDGVTPIPPSQQLNFTYQKIPWGSDTNGSWNQRIVTQFAQVLSAPSSHIYDKLDSEYLIHKGVVGPGFTRTRIASNPSSILQSRLTDDWSYSTAVANTALDGQAQRFFPVSPTYTNDLTNFAPVTPVNYSKDICDAIPANFQRVLVEEFDGYTWRRIAGLGPLPGRETYNVTVTDSIPIQLSWNAFTNAVTLGVTATYTPLTGNPKFSGYVKWTVPVMLVGESGLLTYSTIAKSPCVEKTFVNAGWIWSDVDSPDSSAVNLKLTCNPVPPTPPVQTSLVKTADKTNVVVGDVVTYTLTFTNQSGSMASWAGASTLAADWQAFGNGVIPKLTGPVISLDQNGGNTPPGTYGYAFGHKKSHGVNGYIDATIVPTNSSTFSFIYRYKSGTPGQSDFQGLRLDVTPNIGGNNFIAFTLYNNTTPIATITGLSFGGSPNPIKIKTQLVDDKLYIWINDYTGAPLKVISGITQLSAGYAGIYANGSQQSISSYTTHFDSAFDLVITDPVPAQLNNVVNISNTGVLTGSTVIWPTISGPILASAIIVRTFQATINTCTNFITNIANASVYGVTNIQSQYVITCGAVTTPCTKPVITSAATGAICSGVAQSYAITSSLTSTYTWTRAFVTGITNAANTAGTGTPITETLTNTTTAAVVVRYIITPTSTTGACVGNPFNYDVTVNALPTIGGTLTVCLGSTTQLIGSGTAAAAPAWSSATPAVATVDNTGLVTGVTAGTSVITYTNNNGCKITATVTISALPTITGTLSACVGLTTQLTGSATAAVAALVSATPAVATVDNTGLVTGVTAGTSVITYTNNNGCKITATVTINALPTITGTLSACVGLTTQLTGSATAAAAAWVSATPAVATVDNTGLVTGVTAGTSVITYTNNNGCKITATVTISALPTITGTLSACVGLTTQLTGSATAAAAAWASANTAVATVDNTGLVTGVTAGTSVITYTNNNGCKITATVTISALPTITGTLTVCIGSTTQLTGSGTPNGATPWTSASTAIATITNAGVVTGVSAGTSDVTYITSAGCIKTATVTVNPKPTITSSSTGTTCTGVALNYLITSDILSSYSWVRSPSVATPAPGAVSSANPITETLSSTTAVNVVYTISPTSTAGSCLGTPFTYTVAVSATVAPAVTITAHPGLVICAGKPVTFSTTVSAGGTPTYQWFINGTSQGVASSAAGSDKFSSSTLAGGDKVKVEIISSLGCAVPSNGKDEVVMDVNPIPTPSVSITVNDADRTICPNTSITFAASPTVGGTPPAYTWKLTPSVGAAVTVGTNSATYSTTTAVDGDIYTVEMVSSALCAPTAPVTSNPITITVTQIPILTVTAASSSPMICSGQTITFTATPGGTGSTPTPTYEWFIGPSGPGTAVSSSTLNPFTTTTLTTTAALSPQTYTVYVKALSTATCASTTPVQSIAITVVVNAGVGAGAITTSLSTLCYGTTPVAITESSAATGGTSPTYTWEESTDNEASWNPAAGTVTGTGFMPSGTKTGNIFYRRTVTFGSVPAPCNTSTTTSIKITVRPILVAGFIGSDQTICSGAVPATMSETTAPTGGTGSYTYQWQSDVATIGVFVDISGATNSSYTSGAITRITQFRRKETSGTCGSVTSNVVIKDISAPEGYTVSINDPGVTCTGPGSSITFTATATASTPVTGTLSYAWSMTNTVTGIVKAEGTNSPTYVYSPVVIGDDNKVVKVVVTTTNGCSTAPWISNLVILDIVDASIPTVTIKTLNNPNCVGLLSTFTLTSTGVGGSPTYQWYVIPFGSTIRIAVGGGTTYSTSTLGKGDQVYAELTSSLPCLIGTNPFTSNVVTMVIKPIPAPSITEGDQTVCSPNGFTFHGNVTANNSYEWRQMPGNTVVGTNADYTASQSGTYMLYEDNGTCNSTSSPVTLTIIQTPIAYAGADIYMKEGDLGSLNGSGGAVYSWSPATYLSSAVISHPSFAATQTITYTLTVSDPTNTCSSTDAVTVFVVKPIKVPNVITVNGDGANDDWEIDNIEGYPNVIIEIYNRWGNLVWKSQGYPKNWDGTNFRNGQVLPDGTYFYIINLQSQVYEEPLTGWVQIIK